MFHSAFPFPAALSALDAEFDRGLPLPADPIAGRIVSWYLFRTRAQAIEFAHHIMLTETDRLVGGRTRDSLGQMYWVGVQVSDLERWGQRRPAHNVGNDPHKPDSTML